MTPGVPKDDNRTENFAEEKNQNTLRTNILLLSTITSNK
jgi:hypothetical protein